MSCGWTSAATIEINVVTVTFAFNRKIVRQLVQLYSNGTQIHASIERDIIISAIEISKMYVANCDRQS